MGKFWNTILRWFTDTWNWEILALTFSFACLAAIVGLLFNYDAKVFPDLTQGITLNTVLSFLASAAKAGLLTAVAASFAQWKWLQLDGNRSRRSLHELQALDDASRGPWGALMVMFRTRTSIIIILGALVTVLALAFEPFVQQTIAYQSEVAFEASNTARMPYASSFTLDFASAASDQDIATARTVIQEAFLRHDVGLPHAEPVCQSGNCTWDQYAILGLCSHCLDVTQHAKADVLCDANFNCTQRAIDGSFQYVYWDSSDPTGSVAWLGIMLDSTASNWTERTHGLMPDPVFAMEAIWYGLYGIPSRALECGLSFCIRTRNTTSLNGLLSTEEIGADYPKPSPAVLINSANPDGRNNWAFKYQPTIAPTGDAPASFAVGNSSSWVVRALLIDTFLRFRLGDYWQMVVFFDSDGLDYTALDLLLNSTDNLPMLFDKTALAFTDFMQNISTSSIAGSAGLLQSKVHVRWPWIAYPLTVFVLSIVFLLCTKFATGTTRMMVW